MEGWGENWIRDFSAYYPVYIVPIANLTVTVENNKHMDMRKAPLLELRCVSQSYARPENMSFSNVY